MVNYVGCSRCGKRVSREVDGDLLVRAFVECPECSEKQPDLEAEIERLKTDRAGWAARSLEQFNRIGKALDGVRRKRASGEPARDDATEIEALVAEVERQRRGPKGGLSDRVRPGSEAAPWVVEEIKLLEAEVGRLKEWQRQMVEKAAEKSLDGYRELGAKCASLEAKRDEIRTAVADMLREDEKRTHCHSPDMGGLPGLTIRVQQGERGRPWHEARARVRAMIGR